MHSLQQILLHHCNAEASGEKWHRVNEQTAKAVMTAALGTEPSPEKKGKI